MSKGTIFNFRLDDEDRRRLEELARRLERSRSDAVRWLIRRAATWEEAAGDANRAASDALRVTGGRPAGDGE